MMHRLRTQIPLSHELGITGWRVECLAHWGSECPSLYLAGKLMWDHTADTDAILADFYEKYFGPAAGPMAQYFTLVDNAVRDGDFHTGSAYPIPNLYPTAVRTEARTHLAEAAKLAGPNGPYADRVAMFAEVLAYTETFIRMIELRNAHDWQGSADALAQVDALREKLAVYEIELVTKRYGISYMKRFFRSCTEQGYERAVVKGTLLAGLQDEWAFKKDPGTVGEPLQWYSPDCTGGNWGTLRTSSLSWSDQDLRTYKGDGWYRQTVALPEPIKGKVFLWVGGVDEKARVWVNGQSFGDSPGRAFVPFEFDVTDAVQPGKPNVVVVRVTNTKLNELGTGGITAPVFFWTPKDQTHKANKDGKDVTPIEFR